MRPLTVHTDVRFLLVLPVLQLLQTAVVARVPGHVLAANRVCNALKTGVTIPAADDRTSRGQRQAAPRASQ